MKEPSGGCPPLLGSRAEKGETGRAWKRATRGLVLVDGRSRLSSAPRMACKRRVDVVSREALYLLAAVSPVLAPEKCRGG